MKKILFSAVSLDVGGIETALIALINYLSNVEENNEYKYDVTLVLEKKQGLFIDILDKKIHIQEYKPNSNKNVLIRKMINLIKQIKFKLKYKNSFDFSVSYATYSIPGSFVARNASKNSTLWCHMDYLSQFKNNKDMVRSFFNKIKYDKFNNLVFVSKKSMETFLEVFPYMKEKVYHINNFIDADKIENQSKISIEENLNILNDPIFINIGRHDEEQKKISRIIEACKILRDKNLKFKVLLIGDGKDSNYYRKLVDEYKLNDIILFLGQKKNPYPYLKLANYFLLTSDYEGSPVVFTEAMVLNKPIITTNVSGSEQIENKYGIVVEKDINKIADKMKDFIVDGYIIKEKFNAIEYNEEIKRKVNKIFTK